MNLYFNGCSFTYGDELRCPEYSAWPALVASALGCDFVNDAVSGGTNDRLVYRTLSSLIDYDWYFVAWTNYARFTEYNPVDNYEINFNAHLNLDTSLHQSNDLKTNYDKYSHYGRMYYAHWFNQLFEFKKWLQQIILLQSFFKLHKKNYLMLNTVNNHLPLWLESREKFIDSCRCLIDFFDYVNDDQLLTEHDQIQKMHSLIDKTRFVGWNQWHIVDLCATHPCGISGHILESGHSEVAKKVLEHYNQLQ